MVEERISASRLERLLAISTAALTVLGALIVGLRHEMPWLPAGAAVAAAVAVVVTDFWGVLRLNRWVANALTILAVAWSLRDFWELMSEAKLMAIGSMLCLLQTVLLFQEKTARIYWHLVVLSVLDVVVAAALDLGPSFVPLLVLFLAVGLGTLALLCAYRETARAKLGDWNPIQWMAAVWQAAWRLVRTSAKDKRPVSSTSFALGVVGWNPIQWSAAVWQATLRRLRTSTRDKRPVLKTSFAIGVVGFERGPDVASQDVVSQNVSLPNRNSQLSSKARVVAAARQLLGRPVVEANSRDDAGIDHWFTAPFLVRQIGLLTGVTMLFAIVFFYATPRLRDGFSPSGFPFGGATTGFRSEVRLLRKGRIHLSDRPVMRVKLSRLIDQRTIELGDDPYFHGAVLPEYVSDGEGSRWVRPQTTNISGFGNRGMMRAVAQTTRSLVRQDIVVEANVSRRFAIQPIQPIEDPTAAFNSGQGSSDRSQQQRYSWATPAIMNNRQVQAIPNPNRRRNEEEETLFREELIAATRFSEGRFPRLTEIAAGVLEQSQLTDGKPFDKAVSLWRHFLAPGQYQYSLNLDISANEQVDPIEDFVANSRCGNCEYFASAMAMMLRSQGIPARLVRGYKGGTFNTVGHYYLIQERDAHSWVEAWMPNESIPPSELAGVPSEGGAWYRFDPTPGRSNQLLIQQPGVGDQVAQAFDYAELLWRDYVLSLNTARQDEIVFDPLSARAGSLPQWVEMRGLRRWLRGFSSLRPVGPGVRAFEGSTAIAVIFSLLAFAAAVYAMRLVWEPLRRLSQRKRKTVNAAPEFYRRLERLVARLAVVRAPAQTPQEMAAVAGERLASIGGETTVTALPSEVVDAYYRLRFGKGRLDKVESDAIEQALAEIEKSIRDFARR